MNNKPVSSFRDMGRNLGRQVLPAFYLARDLRRLAASRFRLFVLRHRERAFDIPSEKYPRARQRKRLLVVITHVASAEDMLDQRQNTRKVECLSRAIESVLCSFSHHETALVINTYRGLNILDALPCYQRQLCQIVEHDNGDPMFIEFAVPDIFLARKEQFDWFLFLEDDLLICDSCFLEKIEEFNRRSPYRDALLVPHRFELNAGQKYYIDGDFKSKIWGRTEGSDTEDVINRLTTIFYDSEIAGQKISFAEFTNPHAACHCLSREQLERWEESGRAWRGKVCWIGPLESAATGCLFERFDLYKPHPDNKWYLEVQHWGTKYSDRFRQAAFCGLQDRA